MDWWLDDGMSNGKKKANSAPVAPAQLTHNDVQGIVAAQTKAARDVAPRAQPNWWNSPLGSASIVGFAILLTGGIVSHFNKDSATQITDEITRQLDQRAAKDSENLNNLIYHFIK